LDLSQSGISLVEEQSDHPRGGDKLMQQFQPLRRYLHDQRGYACHIDTRPVKTGNEPKLNRIAAGFEDDRNRRGHRLCRQRRRSGGRGNHRHLTMNQIGHHRRQLIKVALCPAVFDRHVAAFNITVFA
jgi:hypothetical protein